MDRNTYETKLRKYLAECRRRKPIPTRNDLDALNEFQCRVLGGHMINWLREWGPKLFQERTAFGEQDGLDKNPVICFITSVPGLAAANEILVDYPGSAVGCLAEDFTVFSEKDDDFLFHIEVHSHFEELDIMEDNHNIFEQYPLDEHEQYLFHVDESIMGPLFARGGRHLWKWNGSELNLLQEGLQTWVS